MPWVPPATVRPVRRKLIGSPPKASPNTSWRRGAPRTQRDPRLAGATQVPRAPAQVLCRCARSTWAFSRCLCRQASLSFTDGARIDGLVDGRRSWWGAYVSPAGGPGRGPKVGLNAPENVYCLYRFMQRKRKYSNLMIFVNSRYSLHFVIFSATT